MESWPSLAYGGCFENIRTKVPWVRILHSLPFLKRIEMEEEEKRCSFCNKKESEVFRIIIGLNGKLFVMNVLKNLKMN